MFMVNVKGLPAQLPNFGFTVYTAVCRKLLKLLSVPVIVLFWLPLIPPVSETEERLGAAQV